MSKLLKNKITLDTGKYYFDLNFLSGFTVIGGDSATGKTLLYGKLQAQTLIDGSNDFIFINYKDLNHIFDLIKNQKNKIFIIDNADIILDYMICKHIHEDSQNQYILFGRDLQKYAVRKKNVAILEESERRFTLWYPYMPKE